MLKFGTSDGSLFMLSHLITLVLFFFYSGVFITTSEIMILIILFLTMIKLVMQLWKILTILYFPPQIFFGPGCSITLQHQEKTKNVL